MRKQFALVLSLLVVVILLTVGFSSKASNTPVFEMVSGEKNTMFAAQSFTAIKKDASFEMDLPSSEGVETVAVEVKEGDSAYYRGLSVTVSQVYETTPCDVDCLEVRMQLSTDTGAISTVNQREGGVFQYEEYQVKVSQIAPKDAPQGVSRRAVLLFSTSR